MSGLPETQGLYDPTYEHDACGVGFIADIKNRKSHEIVQQGLEILKNLTHRGAVGADPLAGDGAGILIQLPDGFLREEAARLGIALPAFGSYAAATVFLPQDASLRHACEGMMERLIKAEGQVLLGWRDVPTDGSCLGETVKPTEPKVRMVFVGKGANCADQDAFERKLFVIRKEAENGVPVGAEKDFYLPSLSSRTIVYKGMLLADQVGVYYRDLEDPRMVSALALVHQRFSTNTFPSWRLAHPFRMISHNGEINTLRGNVNWMNARRRAMSSPVLGDDLAKLFPLIAEGQSDTACFDNALELLTMGGYSLPHAMMMLVPEAWAGNPLMDEKRRAFYEYHAALMEPWDGPAAICFTDGRMIGATLDRNGLRPARYLITDDDKLMLASEMGVLPFAEDKIVKKWRLQPGKMLLIDLEAGRLIDDAEIKASLAGAKPYQSWLDEAQIQVEDLKIDVEPKGVDQATLLDRQQVFGYTQEELKFLMQPMAATGQEAIGSMGTDTPIAVLSDKPKVLFSYFKQCFAQVTNPPIDSIREESVMSLVSLIGPRPNLLELNDDAPEGKRLEVKQPILTNEDLEKIRRIEQVPGAGFRSVTLDITWPASTGAAGMEKAIEALCRDAQARVGEGYNILILSDRKVSDSRIPVPSLLAVSAVHHHLIREGLRTQVGLVMETGEAREIHHICCLAGYGAEAINPYLAFETLESMRPGLPEQPSATDVQKRFIKAVDKAILKVMAKMGISTYQSYCGAQIFDAVGLAQSFVDRFFAGTASRIGGVDLAEVAEESVRRHKLAYSDAPIYRNALDVGGEYAWRQRGEEHAWTSESIAAMQHAVRTNSYATFKEFSRLIDENSKRVLNLRSLFEIKVPGNGIPLDEVEPASSIVKRFATGAMSFGSISFEAHSTLAIAMNRIGGKSNTGEGGEEAERFKPLPNGDSMRSAIKQVASGRFGVTADYLVNADDIQIKMAQGAKPGEGGQLPGHKVNDTIAKVRHSTPGVGLISPPPHHDIYSIEDLAQLIFDLKNVNPAARISVKLVSEVGVGTVAAGVAKAKADHVTVSGFDGGTGASPLTSIKHAGSPWEIGLAETHQTLVLNNLRKRVAVQVDGALRTGRDVVVGALLGADEFGFATAPLIAAGCLMMRKCHLNTCPVGVATQDPDLRKRFKGQPEHVINYFFFVAEEVREWMARLGFRTLEEMIGRVDLLGTDKAVAHWKADGLDLSRLFHQVDAKGEKVFNCEGQEHDIDAVLDRQLIAEAQPAITGKTPVKIAKTVHNYDRTVGAMLGGAVAKVWGQAGLPEDCIQVKLTGTAGQSFGAFATRGMTLELEGEGNDYVGKGLSGGKLIIYPPKVSKLVAEDNIIVGNTVLYGATEGECYFRGVGGERFAVRNSGAIAVVEGVGDHGCEYMTGGCVLVIGATGRNFAAGMSGGVAYVLDETGDFAKRCNLAMVELEPVAAEEDAMQQEGQSLDLEAHGLVDVMADMTRDDVARIQALLRNHQHYTGSKRAHDILLNWEFYMPKFVKVMPVEYRRALLEMQKKTGGC